MVININETCDLVIFGAKGDLACRKLLPSLYKLEKANKLSNKMRIIGVGRANWDKNTYSDIVYKSLQQFMKIKIEEHVWKNLFSRLEFCNLDVNDTHSFHKLKPILCRSNHLIIYYFAMPPNTFSAICKGLGKVNLNLDSTRIIIEKPLGSSLKTSKKINYEISKYFLENQIFRIDHYLGKETILNLIAFRFSNSLFYYNWNNKFIDHIQITIAEKIGVEGRNKYFDNTGQIRDMVQNHLLQILTIITMSQPINLCSNNIQNEKVKILKALRPFDNINIHNKVVLGQYSENIINGKKIPSYLDDIRKKEHSNTETFVSMKVNIDNKRWYGVPFYLRTGKRLPKKCSKIVIFFKNVPVNIFNNHQNNLPKNKIIIYLQPNEGINIQILNKIPGLEPNYKLDKINLNFNYNRGFKQIELFDAYDRLLLESIRGNQALFVRKDEVELAWKWIDSIFNSFNICRNPPILYPSGTWGPVLSNIMIEKDGYTWN
ncbi:glucose-6-phosphate dehydrogenase [Buchnera aphidicola]|uniref:glucose-6-phosphate dehydrogenase n=1 Tax=Buchnera aphidicola TaxID=9 RepID=UPI0021C9FBAD|nr:glucose-6-phosphate dehydrogenase [Buchnera aphidicola]